MNDMTTTILTTTDAQPTDQTRILINTDGSCQPNPGPGGWAASLRRMDGATEVKKRCISGGHPDTTNNRMELTAAIEALRSLRADEPAPITVRSDSQYLVKGMAEWLPNWIAKGWRNAKGRPVENADLWQELHRLSEGRNITWEWVRGHAGDEMNEEVDRLASAAVPKAGRQKGREADLHCVCVNPTDGVKKRTFK